MCACKAIYRPRLPARLLKGSTKLTANTVKTQGFNRADMNVSLRAATNKTQEILKKLLRAMKWNHDQPVA